MNQPDWLDTEVTPEERSEASALAGFLESRGDAPDPESARVVALFAAVRERKGVEFARISGRKSTLLAFANRRRERLVLLRIAAAVLGTAVGLAFLLSQQKPTVPAETLLAEREASARAAVETLLAARMAAFDPEVRASGLAESRYQEIYRSVRTERFESLTKEGTNGVTSSPAQGLAPTRIPS